MTPQKTTHTRGAKGGMREMRCEERMDKGWRAGKRKELSSARESLRMLSALTSDRGESDAKEKGKCRRANCLSTCRGRAYAREPGGIDVV